MKMRAGEDDDDIQASLLCLIPWHPSGRKVERYVAAACTMMDRRRNTPPLLVPLCICICIVYFVFHVSIVILQGPQVVFIAIFHFTVLLLYPSFTS